MSIFKPMEFNEHNERLCEEIVSVNGFGYTGSSAVTDLLRECRNVTAVSALVDPPSLNHSDAGYGEVNFYWVLDFKALQEVFINGDDSDFNAALISFLENFKILYQGKNKGVNATTIQTEPLFKRYLNEMLIDILDLTQSDLDVIKQSSDFYFAFTPKQAADLSYNYTDYVFYRRKKISPQQFNDAVKNFLVKVTHSIPSDRILVLDILLQLCPLKEHRPMLPDNLKQISVIRDVRDSFFALQRTNSEFKNFSVQAYADRLNGLDIFNRFNEPKRSLLLWFEDLIYHYNEVKAQIFEFLNIDPADHIRPHMYFNPEISKKLSIGAHKNYHDQDLMDKLAALCPKLCYQDNHF